MIFDDRMKEVEVGGVKVLLLKSQGTYHALGSKCSHYGAPLVNGEYMFCFRDTFFSYWYSFPSQQEGKRLVMYRHCYLISISCIAIHSV